MGKLVPVKFSYLFVDLSESFVCKRYLILEGYEPNYTLKEKTEIVKTNPFGAGDLMAESITKMDALCTIFNYLAVKDTDTDDQWISLFANYSLHNIGDFEQGTISADYFLGICLTD